MKSFNEEENPEKVISKTFIKILAITNWIGTNRSDDFNTEKHIFDLIINKIWTKRIKHCYIK